MGYTLKIASTSPGAPLSLVQSAKALVKEVNYLETAWESSLDQSVIKQMVARLGADVQFTAVGNPSVRKNFTPVKPYYSEVQTKATNSSLFEFVPAEGGKVSLEMLPDRFGAAARVCPSCGGSTVNGRPAVAHSVIPQTIWKDIITAALDEFYIVVESGSLARPGKPGPAAVRSFDSLSQQASGSKVDGKFHYTADANRALYATLFQQSLIMSSYAAQDNSERQCLPCEAVQADASLLQRLQLEKADKLPATAKYNKQVYALDKHKFIGLRFLSDAGTVQAAEASAGVKAKVSVEEVFKRKTLAQIGRFLLGIEKTLEDQTAKNPNSPLLALLLDHWEEFVWVFRTQGLKQAGVNYTGTIS